MKHQLVIGVYYSHKVQWLFDGFDRFSWHFKNISKNIYIQAFTGSSYIVWECVLGIETWPFIIAL